MLLLNCYYYVCLSSDIRPCTHTRNIITQLIWRIAIICTGTDRGNGNTLAAAARLPWKHDGYGIDNIMCTRIIIILRAVYEDNNNNNNNHKNDMCHIV